MKIWRMVFIAAVIFVLDRVSKIMVLHYLSSEQTIKILPILNLRLAFNPGVAFSLFYQTGIQTPSMLILITLLLMGIVGVVFWKTPVHHWIQRLLLLIVFSGALGNLCDRIFYGAVIDFIDLHIAAYHWPVFNFADSFICMAALLLCLTGFQESRSKAESS